jgi:hypothetical protein
MSLTAQALVFAVRIPVEHVAKAEIVARGVK